MIANRQILIHGTSLDPGNHLSYRNTKTCFFIAEPLKIKAGSSMEKRHFLHRLHASNCIHEGFALKVSKTKTMVQSS